MKKCMLIALTMISSLTHAQNQHAMDARSGRLGNACTLNYGTADLEKTLTFYERLNYTVSHKEADKILITDNTVQIYLEKGNDAKSELTYYTDEPDNVVNELKKEGIEATKTRAGIYQLKSPGGFIINIAGSIAAVKPLTGKNLITMDRSAFADASKYPNPTCGAFGEYALPISDLDKSMAFWEKLGFKSAMKENDPYPHAILTDGVFIIGLHQTTFFNEPGLTYFSANMGDRIKKLKAGGLPGGKPIDANNEVFTAPGGQKVFLFGL